MILEVIQSQTFPATYRLLAANLEQQSLFDSPLWYENFLQTVVKQNGTVIWFGLKDNNGAPLLLLPVWQQQHSAWQPTKLSSLANYYTTLYEPLHCITDQNQLALAINQVVTALCRLSWDVIELYPLNPASMTYPLLIEAFKQQKKHVTPYFMYGNWFLLTQSQSFKDYYAARPGQLKNTIKRKENKLKQKTLEYSICKVGDDVEIAVQHFQRLYIARWKEDEPSPDFIPGLAKIAAEQGWLRLGLLLIDQQVVAAQFWLVLHETAYIYKLCQEPAFNNYSPGSLLTAHLMEYVIDVDKVAKVDFLSGDDSYKKDWMSHREERWGLQIANPKTAYGLLQLGKNFVHTYARKITIAFQSMHFL